MGPIATSYQFTHPASATDESTDHPVVSVVVPVYNEEQVLPLLAERLHSVLMGVTAAHEIILVNDGSSDRTGVLLADLARKDPRVRSIHFSRNFGHQAAVTAGLQFARGRAVIVMDADLQDPPELLPALLEKWGEGFDVVYAHRVAREREGFMKRATAHVFYRLLEAMTDVRIPVDTGDFCLMDQRVVRHLNAMPERNRYVRGLRSWVGFRQTAVSFERPARAAGRAKYSFTKSLRLAMDGVVSFSRVPLRLATYLGLFVSAMSFILGVVFIVERLAGRVETKGWASTIVVILFLGGVQLLTLGLMGEYISRVYDEVKQRPLFIVRETVGFEPSPAPSAH
ncbi:MAG TPA: glycosyltransferase family 2 protein [Gemmatimonadaceae bacterium]|nr:glycosyltransferase family 2 protein [Gemmatimonadaceae bacterium]